MLELEDMSKTANYQDTLLHFGSQTLSDSCIAGSEHTWARNELHLRHIGSGPSATRIAAEIGDRVSFAKHVVHKQRHLTVAQLGAPDLARQGQLSRHLEQMTGMTEEQRVTSAFEQILGGEREEDERILTRRLTSFIAGSCWI